MYVSVDINYGHLGVPRYHVENEVARVWDISLIISDKNHQISRDQPQTFPESP